MCLSGQPALKVRLAASSKRDGNAWLCGMSARARSRVTLRKMLVQFSELVFFWLHWNVKSAPPLLRPSPRSLLYE